MSDDKPDVGRGRYSSPWQRAARSATRLLFLKPFVWRLLDVRVHGHDRLINTPETFVVVGNHSSHLDAPLIFGALPGRMSKYLATGAAADHFFDKWWSAAYTSLLFNAFPIERSGKSKSDDHKRSSRRGLAQQLLNDGIPILLFAEGTRSRTGAMGPLRPGAASLAIARNVPVIPVAIVGAYAAWPPEEPALRPSSGARRLRAPDDAHPRRDRPPVQRTDPPQDRRAARQHRQGLRDEDPGGVRPYRGPRTVQRPHPAPWRRHPGAGVQEGRVMIGVKNQKWWGWGDEGTAFHPDDKPKFAPFVLENLGVDIHEPGGDKPDFATLTVPAFAAHRRPAHPPGRDDRRGLRRHR